MSGKKELSTMLVRDLMTVGVPTCSRETPVTDIARLFVDNGFEAIIVLDGEEGHALGVVDQNVLINAYTMNDVLSLKVEDIMREGVPQIPPDIPLAAAAQLMQDWGVRALFLMHHASGIEYPAAMITYQHLLRYLCAQDAEDLRDLGIHAERKSPVETFIQKRDASRRQHTRNF